MDHPFDISSRSPDGRQTAYFALGGEVRFGPLYFALSVGGHSFGQRIFGDAHLWSPDSAMLAVQEWLTLDYSAGPITALVLIDLRQGRAATLARATKAFVVPLAFEGALLLYREERAGQPGELQQADLGAIAEWQALS